MVGTILVVVSFMALILGTDWIMASKAADASAEARMNLETHKASVKEHDITVDNKIDHLQSQMNQRFEAARAGQDKLDCKLDKVLERLNDKR